MEIYELQYSLFFILIKSKRNQLSTKESGYFNPKFTVRHSFDFFCGFNLTEKKYI